MTTVERTPSMGAAAVQLRVSGASYEDIAETLGLNDERAALRAVTKELEKQGLTKIEERDRLRGEEAVRLEALLYSAWVKAEDPDHPEHLTAIRTAVTIIDRRIRLLGLDSPTELVVHTPTTTELENWVSHLVTQSMPALEEADVIDVIEE